MAKVPLYQQNKLAQQAVGVGSADNSGQILASGLGNSGAALANANTQAMQHTQNLNNQAFAAAGINAITNTGRMLTAAKAFESAVMAEERSRVIEGQTAGHLAAMRTSANTLLNDTKDEYRNDPTQARKTYTEKSRASMEQYMNGISDPAVRASVFKAFSSTNAEYTNQIDDWAHSRNNEIAVDYVKSIGPSYVQMAGSLSGSIPEKLKQFGELKNNFLGNRDAMEKVLGATHTQNEFNKGFNAMSKALADSMVENIPKGSAGLQHLDAVSKQLESPDFHMLNIEDRKAVQKDLQGAYKVREAELVNQARDGGLYGRLQFSALKSAALETPEDPKVWEVMRKNLAVQEKDLLKQIDVARKEPNLIVRVANERALEQQYNDLISAKDFAIHKGEHIDAAMRRMEGERRAEAHRAEVTANKSLRLQERQTKAAEKAAQTQAELLQKQDDHEVANAIYTRIEKMDPLLDDPAQHGSEIKSQVTSILADVEKAHTEGRITDATYRSNIKTLRNLAGDAGAQGVKGSWFFNMGGTGPDADGKHDGRNSGRAAFDSERKKIAASVAANGRFDRLPTTPQQKAVFKIEFEKEKKLVNEAIDGFKRPLTPTEVKQMFAAAEATAQRRAAAHGR